MIQSIHELMDEYKAKGIYISEIYHHTSGVVRGWMFVLEYEGKYYLVLNTFDLRKALKGIPLSRAMEVEPRIFDVPVYEDEAKINKVMAGVFVWAKQTGGKNGKSNQD